MSPFHKVFLSFQLPVLSLQLNYLAKTPLYNQSSFSNTISIIFLNHNKNMLSQLQTHISVNILTKMWVALRYKYSEFDAPFESSRVVDLISVLRFISYIAVFIVVCIASGLKSKINLSAMVSISSFFKNGTPFFLSLQSGLYIYKMVLLQK
jgi:hypothetical protein